MGDEDRNHVPTFQLKELRDLHETMKDSYSSLFQMPSLSNLSNKQKTTSSETLKKLEAELSEVKIAYAACSENLERLQMEYERLNKEAEEKVMYNKVKLKEKADMENQYALLSKSKISQKDQQFLETTKLRYKALRNMTQVKFTFDKSNKDRLEGFAFNTVNNKVKHFSIPDCSTLNNNQIAEHIIACMEEVNQTIYADIPLQ